MASACRLAAVSSWFERYRPGGTTDVEAVIVRDGFGPDAAVHVEAEAHPKRLVFRPASDVTLDLRDPEGVLRYVDGVLEVPDLSARLVGSGIADDAGARLDLRGSIDLLGEARAWEGNLERMPFESSIVPWMIETFGDADDAEAYRARRPAGRFAAAFDLRDGGGGGEARRDVRVRPSTLALDLSGIRWNLRDLAGSVEVDADEGLRFSDFGGRYGGGTFRLDGMLRPGADPEADLRIDLDAAGLTEHVRALLPDDVESAADAISVRIEDGLRVRNGRLRAGPDPEAGGRRTARWAGTLEVDGASADLSVPLSETTGRVRLDLVRVLDAAGGSEAERWNRVRAEAVVDRMRIDGRLVEETEIVVTDGGEPGVLLLPRLRGRIEGGTVTARGRLDLGSPAATAPATYEAWLDMSEVDIRGLLPDGSGAGESAGRFGTGAAMRTMHASDGRTGRDPQPATRTRGRVSAGISIAGTVGEPASRRGRGEIHIRDARLYEVPVFLWALQISSLTLPLENAFDAADLAFYFEGDRIIFERLDLIAEGFTLEGRGTLGLPGRQLDLVFRTKGRTRIPILSDLWEGGRDALASIRVTGPLENPRSEMRLLDAGSPAGSAGR